MKKKKLFYILFSVLMIQLDSIKAASLSFGLKTGIQYSKFAFINSYSEGIHRGNFPKYYFMPRYSIGLVGQMQITKSIFLRTELSMEQLISIIIADIGYEEANLRNEFRATCIRCPILIKLQLKQTSFPYLLGGFDFAHFINAESSWYYEYLLYSAKTFRGKTTQIAPTSDFSAAMGLGQEFTVFNKRLFLEARILIGILPHHYLHEYTVKDQNSWKNHLLQLGIGVML